MNRNTRLIIKILISVFLLAFLFFKLDTAKLLETIRLVRPSTFAVALLLACVAYIGRALRWWWILQHAGVEIPRRQAYWLTLVGVLYGLITPGKIGEMGKVFYLEQPSSLTLPSVLWERLLDVFILEILCLPGLIILDAWHGSIPMVYTLLVVFTLAAIVILNSRRAAGWLGSVIPRLKKYIVPWTSGATDVLGSRVFPLSLFGSLFFYAFNFLGAYLIAADLAPEQSGKIVFLFPIIILLGNMPVTFAGLGLRESIAALAVTRLGLGMEIGPALSLIWFAAVTLIPGLIGFSIWNIDTESRWKRGNKRQPG